jgi:hypothetical protein
LGGKEVAAFLTHLAVQQHVAASTQNQAVAALLFLYEHVLGAPLGRVEGIVAAKRPVRLPSVLSREDVRLLLDELRGTPRIAALVMYGGGLRLMECLTLRIKDLDLERGMLTIRDGKGGKDRPGVLPKAAVPELRAHLLRVQALFRRDLRNGWAGVALPDAYARKAPSAAKSWEWQWVFPASRQYREQAPTTDLQAPTTDFQVPTTDFQVPTTDFQVPTTDFQVPTTDFQAPKADVPAPTADFHPPTADLHPPTTDLHPPTTDLHPPTADLHPPTTDLHPPTTDLHPPTTDLHPPTTDLHPPTADLHAPTADLHPPTADLLPPTADLHPPTTDLHPPTADLHPPTADLHAPTADLHPPTADLLPPTTNLHPPTADLHPPTADLHAPTTVLHAPRAELPLPGDDLHAPPYSARACGAPPKTTSTVQPSDANRPCINNRAPCSACSITARSRAAAPSWVRAS